MLTTRCPECGAAFKVAPDQLRVRDGLVRCGECEAVFDGYAGLIEDVPRLNTPARSAAVVQHAPAAGAAAASASGDGSSPGSASASAAQATVPQASALAASNSPVSNRTVSSPPISNRPVSAPHASAAPGSEWTAARPPAEPSPFVWRNRDSFAARPSAGLDAEPSAWDDLDDAHTADSPSNEAREDDGERLVTSWHVQGEARTRQPDAPTPGRAPPAFMDEEQQGTARLVRLAWTLASAAGLVLLLVQGAMVYRTQIALAMPSLRPALAMLCEPLACRVGYARRIERISIMSSSLQRSGEAAAGNELVLRVVLRNRYDLPQEWPALMLGLTDMSDTVVARRVLRPDDYLPRAAQDEPFGAGQEISLAIPVDPGKLPVNGYRIDKFFP